MTPTHTLLTRQAALRNEYAHQVGMAQHGGGAGREVWLRRAKATAGRIEAINDVLAGRQKGSV